MNTGDRIKEARLALGYSAEQVAAFLNVSPATIYRYENGDISKLPSKHLKPLAEFLCVTPEYLMCWTDEKPENPNVQPKNEKITNLVRILNELPPEESDQAVDMFTSMFKLMFPKKGNDLFKKGSNDDANT